MRTDFLLVSFILAIIFAAIFTLAYMNKKRMGPAKRRARQEQTAFCKVHGNRIGQKECSRLFVGLPPAVWDDLKSCDGSSDRVACMARRLCDLGSARGCAVAGRLTGDPSLTARACTMGYDGPECSESSSDTALLQALRGARPAAGWSLVALAYACGEGDEEGCALVPGAWFSGLVDDGALARLPQAISIWVDSCLLGSRTGCLMAGRALGSEPLVIHACVSGLKEACAHLASIDPPLGRYLMTQ